VHQQCTKKLTPPTSTDLSAPPHRSPARTFPVKNYVVRQKYEQAGANMSTNRKSAPFLNGMAIDLLACTGGACGVGNLRALRCINDPATAYLHCMKPVAKIVGDGPKASSLLG